MKMKNNFQIGDRVRFNKDFLRSTGQYAGPDQPTSIGPFARGTVTGIDGTPNWPLIQIRWDNGIENHALTGNLELTRR